jgi:aminoacyl tRNA synthase complex-interacting multifunctional protein 1
MSLFQGKVDKTEWVTAVFALVSPSLKLPEGALLESEMNTVIKEVIRNSPHVALLGSTSGLEAEVYQWLSYMNYTDSQMSTAPLSEYGTKEVVSFLNKALLKKSYFVGTEYTVADIAIYMMLEKNYDLFLSSSDGIPDLKRWFDHVQHVVNRNSKPKIKSDPTYFPAALFAQTINTEVAKETTAAADVPPTPPPPATDGKEGEKKVEGDKKEKKEKKEKVAAPEAAPEKEQNPNFLSIKCGLIVKCWNHPESDKLLCEEIDLGEGTNRTICSGLRAHYTAEEVQGRKVLVVANLKDRPMAGVKSQGMVLCAVADGHSIVKLLEPPASAKPGDAVTFPGYSLCEPLPASQIAKKKILEGLLPDLKTDTEGVAKYKDAAFMIGSEHAFSELKNVQIS